MKLHRLHYAAGMIGAIAALALPGVASAAAPPVNAAAPTITGTAREGQTLTASSGSWGGAVPITYAYAWQTCDDSAANCSTIKGATNVTYKIVKADVGNTIRVKVTADNNDGTSSVVSAPTGLVAAIGTAPAATDQPSPSGNAVDGQTLTANNGTWSGATPMTFTYQWQSCTAQNPTCTDISKATGKTYVLTSSEVGRRVRYLVTAENSSGKGSVNSNLSDVVGPKGTAPSSIDPPVIYGNPAVGSTITVGTGTWSGISKSAKFGYAWDRCTSSGSCSPIAGAHASTYTVASADAGQRLRAKVTATNSSGSTTATSNTVVVAGTSGGGNANSVPVTSLVAHPDHLLISDVKFSPSPFSSPGGSFTLKVKVTLEGTSKVVTGALVYVTCIPYNWVVAQAPETPTGADGWVTLTIKTTNNLPHSGALVMQVRARGPGNSDEAILGGISTRRLIQLSLK